MQAVEHVIPQVENTSKIDFFWNAIENGTVSQVLDCLQKAADPQNLLSQVDDQGRTALHKAAKQDESLVITAITTFIENRSLSLATHLNKVDVQGNTVLHVAIEAGKTEIAKIVINKNASLSCRNLKRHNALMAAVIVDNVDLVSEITNRLITQDQNEILEATLGGSGTVLCLAAYHGYDRSISALLTCLRQKGMPYFSSYLERSSELGSTALLIAASQGHLDVVRLLIESGADKNVMNAGPMNALALSIHSGNVELFKYLINSGISIDTVCTEHGWSLIEFAKKCQKDKNKNRQNLIINYLPMIAVITSVNNLMLLVRGRYLSNSESISELLRGGASLNQTTSRGETPLHLAVNLGSFHIVKRLLAAGASIQAKDNAGATVLDYAQKKGSELDLMKAVLLSHSSDATLQSAVALIASFQDERLRSKAYILVGTIILTEIYPHSENRTFWTKQAYELFSKLDKNALEYREAQYYLGRLLFVRSDILTKFEIPEEDLKESGDLDADKKGYHARITAAYTHFVLAGDFSDASSFRTKIAQSLVETSVVDSKKAAYDFHNPEDQLTVIRQIAMLKQQYAELQQKLQKQQLALGLAESQRREMEAQVINATQALKTAFSSSPQHSTSHSPAHPQVTSPLRASGVSTSSPLKTSPLRPTASTSAVSTLLWLSTERSLVTPPATDPSLVTQEPRHQQRKRTRQDENQSVYTNQVPSSSRRLQFSVSPSASSLPTS